MVEDSQQSRRHFDEVAPEYDRWKARAHAYYTHLKALLKASIPAGESVCEVGCGTGDLLAHLEPSRGVGLDISAGMVEVARAKHPHLDFRVGDISSAPLDERFRFVTCVDVVEHVPEVRTAVTNMAKMLQSGGSLFITTAHPSWKPFLEVAEKLKLKMPEGAHRWRDKSELTEAVVAAGLKIEHYSRSFVAPRSIPLLRTLNDPGKTTWVQEHFGLIQCLRATAPVD